MKLSLFSHEKTLAQKVSLYNQIDIVEEDDVRYLRFGNHIVQSAVLTTDPIALRVDYTRYMPLGLLFVDNCQSILPIGLGAGMVQRLLVKLLPHIKMDSVEIDREVIELSKKYMFLNYNPGFKIHIMDGRQYIRRCKQKYDLIMLDAYNSSGIPFHLTTIEFLKEVKLRLTVTGAVVSNLWRANKIKFNSMIKTYEQVFPYIYRFPVRGVNNVVIVASESEFSKKSIMDKAFEFQNKYKFPYDFTFCADQFDKNKMQTTPAKILKDEDADDNWMKNASK